MKYSSLIKILALIALSTVFSCSLINKDIATKKDDIVVATYESGKVTESQLNKELNRLKSQNPKIADVTLDSLPTSQKELLVKEVILKKAAVKQAKKFNLDDEETYVEAFNDFQSLILQKQLYLKLAKDASSDEKVLARYNELVEESKDKQDLKLGFILLKDEKQAKNIHKRLTNNPNSFSYYAKTRSLDETTKKNKGVIDYSIESSFPDSVVKIAKSLKKYEISEPFPVGNKWGIIRMLDSRQAKIRTFEESKDALKQNMALKAIKDFNDKTLEEAKINLIVR